MKRVIYVVVACAALVAPAAGLVRVGTGGVAGFAFPAGKFDNDAKTAPLVGARVTVNLFPWLAVDAGADFHLPHGPESRSSSYGRSKLYDLRAGLSYELDMGEYKPLLAAGWLRADESIMREKGWEHYRPQGLYAALGLEYYITERFYAGGSFGYNRYLDGARDGQDTQFIKLDFGAGYFIW